MKTLPSNPSISVVVPVFHSATTLNELVRRLHDVLEAHFEIFEVLLVDDGSRDGGWNAIRQLAARHPWVRAIQLMRNYGQHNALLCGIRAARHGVIVTLDDDLQQRPEEIPLLVAKLDEGFDVVYGALRQPQHGRWRNGMTRLTKLALKTVMRVPLACEVSSFKAFRASLRRAFAHYQAAFVSIDVLLSWATTRFASVPVRHDPRREGRSHYTIGKLAAYTLNVITGFSILPLRLASFIGFAFTFFGLAVLAYVVGRYLLEGGTVPGFPFLASIIAIFSGAQLFAVGILGEYLARMHLRMMDRPTYVIESTLNLSEKTIRHPGAVGAAARVATPAFAHDTD